MVDVYETASQHPQIAPAEVRTHVETRSYRHECYASIKYKLHDALYRTAYYWGGPWKRELYLDVR